MVVGTSLGKQILGDGGIEQTTNDQTNVVQTQHVDRSTNLHSARGLECETVGTNIEANKGRFVHNAGFLVQQLYILKSDNHTFCLFGVSTNHETLFQPSALLLQQLAKKTSLDTVANVLQVGREQTCFKCNLAVRLRERHTYVNNAKG